MKPLDYSKIPSPRETYDKVKTHLSEYVETVLDRSKGRDKYCCPFCGSGTGKNGTGEFSIMKDRIHWGCRVCGRHGDIFDLYAAINKTDTKTSARELVNMYDHKPINTAARFASQAYQTNSKPQPLTAEQIAQNKKLAQCYHAIIDTPAGQPGRIYLMGRGLSLDTISKYKIGYNPARRAVTFPHDGGLSYFSSRFIDAHKGGIKNRYEVLAGHVVPLFNPAALRGANPCFVTEGIIDALSILQCGGTACALNGVGNLHVLLDHCRKKKPACTLILALDGDEAGRTRTAELARALDGIGVAYIEGVDIVDPVHDINDRLQADPEALKQQILADVARVEAKA